jgi:aspartate-semialdehyde dehydrogenase
MLKVGLIGWRGMVGSVLLDRMREEQDLSDVESFFFSTSNIGGEAPQESSSKSLHDAFDVKELKKMDILISCQGGDYTKQVYSNLRNQESWNGYWIDAASTLRMTPESIIILDPVNKNIIANGLSSGIKTYVGGNCTVSLMLMALGGLFEKNLIEWLTSMTYQAASGGGAKTMIELMEQTAVLGDVSKDYINNPARSALDLERAITEKQNNKDFPCSNFGAPLAGSLIPWIDVPVEDGQTKEEWKGMVETNKILGSTTPIPVDGVCVRIGALRCHSQAFTIKLKKDLPLSEITSLIAGSNDWVKVIENTKEQTLAKLSPVAVSGKLDIPVGRIRKMKLGPEYLTAFSVGDQLLWGAAEPLRRMLRMVVERG